MNRFVVVLAVAGLAGCKAPAGGEGGKAAAAGSHPACAGARVDLTKLSGDWVAASSIPQPDGTFAGNQYRLRFMPAAADGTVKAHMAWRLDSRPFAGTISTTALGQKMVLVEDMSAETIDLLKKANNQDPNLPMRASIHVEPAETGCVLAITDNFQTFLGDKVIEKTSAIGTLKLVPAKADEVLSFVRCEVQKGVTFDGKAADDNGRPVQLKPGTPVKVGAIAARNALPAECSNFTADVFVDGVRVQEKVPSTMVKEENVDAVKWETETALKVGPIHGVELHAYADCGQERKLVASACNVAYAQ